MVQVIQAAHEAASRLGDSEAHRVLADAQRDLAVAIRAVVDSHGATRGNRAVTDAMAVMDNATGVTPTASGAAKNVLNTANDTITVRPPHTPRATRHTRKQLLTFLLQAIDKAVANTRPTPEQALTSSKEVSEHARLVPSSLPPLLRPRTRGLTLSLSLLLCAHA